MPPDTNAIMATVERLLSGFAQFHVRLHCIAFPKQLDVDVM